MSIKDNKIIMIINDNKAYFFNLVSISPIRIKDNNDIFYQKAKKIYNNKNFNLRELLST